MESDNQFRPYPPITTDRKFPPQEMNPMEAITHTEKEIKEYLDELKKDIEQNYKIQTKEIEELSNKPQEVCLLIDSKKSPSAFRKVLSDGFVDDLVEKYRPRYDGTETVKDWWFKTSKFLIDMGKKVDCLEILMEENELEFSE